jgi:hypothetical protein
MSPADERSALMLEGRAFAEEGFIDVCAIYSEGTRVYDKPTGKYIDTPGTLLYGPTVGPWNGKCKRQVERARLESTVDAGGHDVSLRRLELHIPADAPPVTKGASVTMLVCPNDPSAVGQKYQIQGPGGKTFATKQALSVVGVAG